MAKKKMGAEAPKVEQPAATEQVTVEQQVKMDYDAAGMDPNRRMDLIRVMHETFRMDPMAAQHTGFSQDAVNQINKINAAMQAAALICEVTQAKNKFTALIPQKMVNTLEEISAEVGIHFNTKMLPAPDKDGNIAVPSDAIIIAPETKKQAKEEIAIVNALPELNPSTISSHSQLREAIIYTLADTKTNVKPYDRINAAIDLFKSWKYFHPQDEKEKESIGKIDRAVLLHDMIKLVGSCPFSITGFSNIMYTAVAQTKSPIPAFCMFRNNSRVPIVEGKVVYPVDDATVANFVKHIVIWNAESQIKRDQESIAKCKKNISVLNKDKKANAAAIERENKKIEGYEGAIVSYNDIIGIMTSPSQDYANNIHETYDNRESDDYRTVHRLCSNIMESYYPDIKDPKTIQHKSFLDNMQQHIGKINNLFCDPASQDVNYIDGNITEFIFEEPKDEESETKEEPKEEKAPKK